VNESSRDNSLGELLESGLARLGLPLDAHARQRMLEYLWQLERWNQAYNLTGVRNPRDMVPQHLLDSLAVVPWLDGNTLLDLGSGAGLPGIPIAIARPDLAVTLLDSNLKKSRFLDNVVRTLALDNVQVVRARAEDYHPSGGFQMIIARAVGSAEQIGAAATHLMAETGRLLLMKGAVPEEELAALGSAFDIEAIRTLDVPDLNKERCLIVLRRADDR
jgi:16S rRNA (guanine527-N7)-methyltransferase